MHSHTLQQTADENKAFIRLELLGGFRFLWGNMTFPMPSDARLS